MPNRLLSAALTIACAMLAIALIHHETRPKIERCVVPDAAISLSQTVAENLALVSRHIERVRLDDVTLDEAIHILSAQTNVNIRADWRSLAGAGLDQSRRFSVHLNNVTLDQALSALLSGFGSNVDAVRFIDDGVVIITTEGKKSDYARTECFNIRPLIEDLRPAFHDEVNNQQIVDAIIKFIIETASPDSRRESGGGEVGPIHEMAGILLVTETPENLAAAARVLRQIQKSTHTNDFPSITEVITPSTQPGGGIPSTQPITQCVNLGPLVEKLRTDKSWPQASPADPGLPTRAEIVAEIERLLTDTIDPGSWRENDGLLGSIHACGPFMVITQTPANLRAVHRTLDNLFHATSANYFLSATQPSAATTRESGSK